MGCQPGSSLVNAPADTDFADPVMAAELEDAFGGDGYTAPPSRSWPGIKYLPVSMAVNRPSS